MSVLKICQNLHDIMQPQRDKDLAIQNFEEEVQELLTALSTGSDQDQRKELCDVLVTACDIARCIGFDITEGLAAVNTSNHSKILHPNDENMSEVLDYIRKKNEDLTFKPLFDKDGGYLGALIVNTNGKYKKGPFYKEPDLTDENFNLP